MVWYRLRLCARRPLTQALRAAADAHERGFRAGQVRTCGCSMFAHTGSAWQAAVMNACFLLGLLRSNSIYS